MKTRTSCYSSSAACALLPVCNISHFCRTSTSPLHFHLCASRQQGKQQWAFYFDLSFGFPHDLSHDCSQTDISPLDSPPYRNQGVSFHHKTADTSSSTWPSEFSYYSIMLYLGINRNTRKCIHPCFRKKCDSARTFLHIAQFRMKAPDEIIDGQNVWSYSCPRRWRVQSGVIAAPM